MPPRQESPAIRRIGLPRPAVVAIRRADGGEVGA
jgi:secreted PhoX family phosphatase